MLFKNDKGILRRQKITANDQALTGWWSAIKVADINGDGYADLLLGNFGENSKLKTSAEFPLKMYSIDFYKTGREHQVMAIEKEKKYYPFLKKEDLENQLPYLKKEFLKYGEMAGKTVEEIFKEKLNDARLYTAATFSSVLLLNDGKGGYAVSDLPGAAQWSPVFTFAVDDFNKDGVVDFMSGGNFYGIRPYEGRYDAAALNLFYGAGKNAFQTVLPLQPSLAHITGEIRDIRSIQLHNNKKGLLVAVSNGPLHLLSYE